MANAMPQALGAAGVVFDNGRLGSFAIAKTREFVASAE